MKKFTEVTASEARKKYNNEVQIYIDVNGDFKPMYKPLVSLIELPFGFDNVLNFYNVTKDTTKFYTVCNITSL